MLVAETMVVEPSAGEIVWMLLLAATFVLIMRVVYALGCYLEHRSEYYEAKAGLAWKHLGDEYAEQDRLNQMLEGPSAHE